MRALLTSLVLASTVGWSPVGGQERRGAEGGGGRPSGPYTAAFVIERTTGRVLLAENADQPVLTASMAKMMTCLIVAEAIESGRLELDGPVRVSAEASAVGGSTARLRRGETLPVRDLLAATVIQSANDAATALAEAVAGSVDAFVLRMNERAVSLGLGHARFYDPHGLPGPNGRNDVMSAHDLAKLAMEFLDHPLLRELAGTASMPFQKGRGPLGALTSSNLLLTSYPGAYGVKTGHTSASGFSVTAAARRDGMDLVVVVAGAATGGGPNGSFDIAARLLDRSFRAWAVVNPVREGGEVGTVRVVRGRTSTVTARAARSAVALVPRARERLVHTVLEATPVEAPIRKGQPVGEVLVVAGDSVWARVPALAATDVPKAPWWAIWKLSRRS